MEDLKFEPGVLRNVLVDVESGLYLEQAAREISICASQAFTQVYSLHNLALLQIKDDCIVLSRSFIVEDNFAQVQLDERLDAAYRNVIEKFVGQLKLGLLAGLQMGDHTSDDAVTRVQFIRIVLARCNLNITINPWHHLMIV